MVSPAGLFSIYLEVLLLLYTVVPLPLYGTLIIGVIYSLLFEILLCFAISDRLTISNFVINLLLHICIHVIGIHILITIQVLYILLLLEFMYLLCIDFYFLAFPNKVLAYIPAIYF